MSNYWQLPKSPPMPSMAEVVRIITEQSYAVQHEQLEAIEQLCYYAQRDGHAVFVTHVGGIVQDAHVNRHALPGRVYYADVSHLSFYT